MASPLKYPKDFKIGDVIKDFGFDVTILELVEIQERKGSSSKWYVYKVCNNFSENVYLHRYVSYMPVSIKEGAAIGEEEVRDILNSRPFKEHNNDSWNRTFQRTYKPSYRTYKY